MTHLSKIKINNVDVNLKLINIIICSDNADQDPSLILDEVKENSPNSSLYTADPKKFRNFHHTWPNTIGQRDSEEVERIAKIMYNANNDDIAVIDCIYNIHTDAHRSLWERIIKTSIDRNIQVVTAISDLSMLCDAILVINELNIKNNSNIIVLGGKDDVVII